MEDPEVARLSRDTDPMVIGQRIRNARIAAGLTQEELGEGEASGAYISRIEAGNRRAGMRLLAHVAQRLGTSVEQLVADESMDPGPELDLRLDYADLALKSGDAQAALASAEEVLGGADRTTAALVARARQIRASASEVLGDYQAAISELERLTSEGPRDLRWIGMVMTLSRCYRTCGDFARAIEVGTEAAVEIERQGLAGTEEAIRLTLTVATALMNRGDVDQAARMCQRCVEDAEAIGSDLALASAYWNSSLVQSIQGDVPAAVLLAKRAIDTFESGNDARSLAILQGVLADTQLRLDPPDVEGAESSIEKALEGSSWSDASKVTRQGFRLTFAKVLMARGRLAEARATAREVLEVVEDVSPQVASDAYVILGRIGLEEGGQSEAVGHFQRAAQLLASCGADRWVAQCWFELGALLERVGEEAAALDAFRRAAASTGLLIPDSASVRV